ncbi:hypothetical protein GCM10009119_38510 [Algoriphagus jejuensis]|uniref:Glycosyltransferase 2-like domain-containing protein n=1 Tax=Algoriphagus jejuensis TaxID=419934 RepID=A0ABP3YKV0_9BACT
MSSVGVSIVICTYNGVVRLEETLSHLLKLDSQFPWELVLVDNASTDGTAQWVSTWLKSQAIKVSFQIVVENRPGLNNARVAGFQRCSFDYILFCDDDNWLFPDFVELGATILSNNSRIGVLGSLGHPVFEDGEPEWFSQFSHSYAVGSLGKNSGKQDFGSYHYGAACFFRRAALKELLTRGFRSLLADRTGKSLSSGGDVELGLAVQLLGYELHYDERLKFDHFIETHRLNWDYYLRLKRGISKSFPLLESYKCHEFQEVTAFRSHLVSLFFISIKGLVKSFVWRLCLSSKSNEVAFATTQTKCVSFLRNYRKTLAAFVTNKQLFDA